MADPKAPEMPEGWEIDAEHSIAWNPACEKIWAMIRDRRGPCEVVSLHERRQK